MVKQKLVEMEKTTKERIFEVALDLFAQKGFEGVSMREIAEAVARRLGMVARSVTAPQAEDYLGWLAHLAAMDIVVSSDETRRLMDWRPTGPGLIDDLNRLRAVAA